MFPDSNEWVIELIMLSFVSGCHGFRTERPLKVASTVAATHARTERQPIIAVKKKRGILKREEYCTRIRCGGLSSFRGI